MTKITFMVMMIFTVLSVGSNLNAASHTPDLSQYRWKNRLLLIFAPNRSHPMFDVLHQSLAAKKSEASDRDLVIFEILESAASSMNDEAIDSESARLLREKFNVQPGEFTVILIGKDGGVKLKHGDRADLREIFDLIDSMPMRQEEMRRKTK